MLACTRNSEWNGVAKHLAQRVLLVICQSWVRVSSKPRCFTEQET